MQTFRVHLADGIHEFSEEMLAKYARIVGLDRVAPSRYSWAFVLKMHIFERLYGINPFMIVDEIKKLEGLDSKSSTKRATPFTKPPLSGLWHQHFFSGRFVAANVYSQLGNGKRTAELGAQYLDPQPDGTVGEQADWEGFLHAVTVQQFEERQEQGRLTGEWIVFGKHEGRNYYLLLSPHTTGVGDQKLFDEIKLTCQPQFPFLPIFKQD